MIRPQGVRPQAVGVSAAGRGLAARPCLRPSGRALAAGPRSGFGGVRSSMQKTFLQHANIISACNAKNIFPAFFPHFSRTHGRVALETVIIAATPEANAFSLHHQARLDNRGTALPDSKINLIRSEPQPTVAPYTGWPGRTAYRPARRYTLHPCVRNTNQWLFASFGVAIAIPCFRTLKNK